MRENTAEILELASYKVFHGKNGKDGVELAQKEKAIIYYLRHHDARAGRLRSASPLAKILTLRNTFIFFFSPQKPSAVIPKGMEMGADDYVTKPF